MTDEEMMKKIDDVMLSFTGQFDDLSQIVGMIVLGRQYGWRVIRLVHSRRSWTLACKYFGDLKLILPKDGKPEYVRKSVGFAVVDALGRYWEFIKGNTNRDDLPVHERKKLI